LKLNPALFLDRSLFDRDHLSLHLGKLGGCLLVAADEEGRRPEDHDSGSGRQAVIGTLMILSA
jgi:hypothetical protein